MNRQGVLASLVFGLVLGLIGCGGETAAPVGGVGELWTYEADGPIAPPGAGVDRRVLLFAREAIAGVGGRFRALDQRTGNALEGPFDGAPLSQHAPLMVSDRVYVLSTIGALACLDLAGQTLFMVPPATPSGTSPLALGSDGTVRWGTAAGELVSVALDGTPRFRTMIGDPVTTAIGVSADGRSYAATDTGRVVGVDAMGTQVFEVTVEAPASGPSVAANGDVAVGAATSLVVFGSNGAERWRHPRAARVVGTQWVGDRVLAWGEDGVIERLDAAGAVELTFRTGADVNAPPIYAPPMVLDDGAIGVLDASGTAHVADATGSLSRYPIGAEPLREATPATEGRMLVAVGSSVHVLQFVYGPPAE